MGHGHTPMMPPIPCTVFFRNRCDVVAPVLDSPHSSLTAHAWPRAWPLLNPPCTLASRAATYK
jgi:hypothetical protein